MCTRVRGECGHVRVWFSVHVCTGVFALLYSRTSIIRYPAWQFSLKMGVSTAVTMDTGMFIFCACADAHMHCCLSIKWVDQGVVYPFDYPAYQLSGLPLEPSVWIGSTVYIIVCYDKIRLKLDTWGGGSHFCTVP